MAKAAITRINGDFYAALVRAMNHLGVRLISPGDHVLIKPNLVEPASPDSGEITTPQVIEVVARYCLDYGAARVIIGEGPSYYQPELYLKECFTRTGVSQVAERLGIEWVLFDEHPYRTFKGVSESTPDEFRVTEFAFTCDKFINLPVLKTHYLTKVTLAMKNLKGCLKREDKRLFHRHHLSRAIVELCQIVKPTVNVIDGTARALVRQLGTGYAPEGGQFPTGLIIASTDIVAVDTVGCALMGIDPAEVETITLGARAGLGMGDLTRIDITGEELKQLKFRVQLPQEQLKLSFPALEIIGAEKSCSGCLLPLLHSLLLIQQRQIKADRPLTIYLGEKPEILKQGTTLLVGDCARVEGEDEYDWVTGCPPDREELLRRLLNWFSS